MERRNCDVLPEVWHAEGPSSGALDATFRRKLLVRALTKDSETNICMERGGRQREKRKKSFALMNEEDNCVVSVSEAVCRTGEAWSPQRRPEPTASTQKKEKQ